jgi:hypothetical protein
MPNLNDIRAIANQALRDVDAIYDFLEHSRIVWRTFKAQVDEGLRITAEFVPTGTRIDQAGLVTLSLRYQDYLAEFTFRQFVSAFESFFFSFFHFLLRHNPWPLAKN